MTVRIYPSRLAGKPLEVHEHDDGITVHEWFTKNVKNYTFESDHPLIVEINEQHIAPAEWPLLQLRADTDVRIYPIPRAVGLVIAVVVALAASAYALYMMSQMGSPNQQQGNELGMGSGRANAAKLGQVIREVFGLQRVYPDYVVPPVSRFIDKTNYQSTMFVNIGKGQFSLAPSTLRIGNTPVSALGSTFSYKIYRPGAFVGNDPRTENWYSSTEVGNTSSGGAGLDMGRSAPEEEAVSALSVTAVGRTLTFSGSEDPTDSSGVIPDGWVKDVVVTVLVPDTYTIINTGRFSSINGNSLSELAPFTGMPVTVTFDDSEVDLVVSSWTPAETGAPGSGGTPASVTGSAAPVTLDFSVTSVRFSLQWGHKTIPVLFDAAYVAIADLVSALNVQLAGSGLSASRAAGVLTIRETSAPYTGEVLSAVGLPVDLFGAAPLQVSGVASSGGGAGRAASMTLAYGSETGAPFSGVPDGIYEFSIGLQGNEYQITDIDGLTVSLTRLSAGQIDSGWPGFSGRTNTTYRASSIIDHGNWLGPFLACPPGDPADSFEVDFSFPAGICSFNKKGKKKKCKVGWEIQWREYGSGQGWSSKTGSYSEKTINGLGFTERINLDSSQIIEVRCRRTNEQGKNSARDTMYWKGLRVRLGCSPSAYADITTLAITLTAGDRVAAQSDRRINAEVTRLYDNGAPPRSISGALYHALYSMGFDEGDVDTEVIDGLDSTYWTPRGEFFDWQTNDSRSSLETLQKICNAGMSYLVIADGLISVGREGIKPWTGVITPQEQTRELETSFRVSSRDDYDGVDVTFISRQTWSEETIRCRYNGESNDYKVENYKLEGVIDMNKAFRIGMRRLLGYRYQRLVHTTTTELDALCYQYGDHIILTSDIPGDGTTSCLMTSVSYDSTTITIRVSEPLDWSATEPRCMVRFQDGSASALLIPTRIDDHTLTIDNVAELDVTNWIMNDPCIEPPRLIFCDSVRIGYPALLQEITPSSDGTCDVSAIQYDPRKYEYDDDNYLEGHINEVCGLGIGE